MRADPALLLALEQSTGPDEDLDFRLSVLESNREPIVREGLPTLYRHLHPPHDECLEWTLPSYTSSVDLALSLVPPDMEVELQLGPRAFAAITRHELVRLRRNPLLATCERADKELALALCTVALAAWGRAQ